MTKRPRTTWPRTAVIAVVMMASLLLAVSLLWITGRTVWGGPYDPDVVGSLGEWGGGFATATAVWLAYRQFSKGQAAVLQAEHRLEALKVTAWATWLADGTDEAPSSGDARRFSLAHIVRPRQRSAQDARAVRVSNRASSAVYDWIVIVVPSGGWDRYMRFSSLLGPLHPDATRTVPASAAIPTVTSLRHASRAPQESPGPPRFVVLTFNDAWGNGWIRTNGDLQRVPPQSRFLPLLVHLRNPAMPWAGLIDEATWMAFREATGSPATLPERLVQLLPDKELPWLTWPRVQELNRTVEALTLRERGTYFHPVSTRGLSREVRRQDAYHTVRQFFADVGRSRRGEILYLEGD